MASRPGDLVAVRGAHWAIAGVTDFGPCSVLDLAAVGVNSGRRLRVVTPFDRPRGVARTRPRRASRRHVLTSALNAIKLVQPADALWVAGRAHIDLLPYQLVPALAVLGGATRVLLADGVGLGKTIQAGLIVAELRERGLARRVLIVTPAGLRRTWDGELRERFGLAATILDQPAIASSMWLAIDVNPWTRHDIVIASLDFIKRPDVLPSVEAAPFDVVIADEAHHLTPGSERGTAVDRLARRATWVVICSATPHSGDDAAYEFLSSIGRQRDTLTVFQRQRDEVGVPLIRRRRWLAVVPNDAERAMLEAADHYASELWKCAGPGHPAGQLVAATIKRRAASSAAALLKTVRRRLALLTGQMPGFLVQPRLPWEEVDDEDGDAGDDMLAARGFADEESERRLLEAVLARAERAQLASSKFERILRLTERAREPVVVFSEFRDTIEAFARASGQRSLAIVHGGLDAAGRHHAIERFTKGAVDLLLATDAAGEGLNLQQRCRVVVNLELPWNPRRLEQRAGRVDRLGQSRRVHALHLYHRGTVEDTVLAQLERRWRSAAEWSRANTYSELDVARAVFDEQRLTPIVGRGATTDHGETGGAVEAQRLRESRQVRRCAFVRPRPVWTDAPASNASPLVVRLIFEVCHRTHVGHTLETGVVALEVAVRQRPASRLQWKDLLRDLVRDPAVRDELDEYGRRRAPLVVARVARLRRSVVHRLCHIARSHAASKTRLQQGSLFDRRHERVEAARQERDSHFETHLRRTMAALDDQEYATRAPEWRLIAVWPTRS